MKVKILFGNYEYYGSKDYYTVLVNTTRKFRIVYNKSDGTVRIREYPDFVDNWIRVNDYTKITKNEIPTHILEKIERELIVMS